MLGRHLRLPMDGKNHTYTIGEAALYLKVSERTIRRWIKRNLLRTSKSLRKKIIPAEGCWSTTRGANTLAMESKMERRSYALHGSGRGLSLRLSTATIYSLIQRGVLRASTVTRKKMIPAEDVEKLVVGRS